MKVAIIPSLLEHTPEALRARLRLVEAHGVAQVQLDCADRTFVPAATFHDPAYLDALHPHPNFEIHLMTNVTRELIQRWRRPWVKKIIFHLEATPQPQAILEAIGELGKLAGIALSPPTPVEAVAPFLPHTDTLLIMGVNPGWGGQTLLPETVTRLRAARRLHPHGNVEIDGGVNPATVAGLAAAGANLLVVGSALTAGNFPTMYQQLTDLAHAAGQT